MKVSLLHLSLCLLALSFVSGSKEAKKPLPPGPITASLDHKYVKYFNEALPPEMVPQLVEEGKMFDEYEDSRDSESYRWLPRKQINEGPLRCATEVAIALLSRYADPFLPKNWGGAEWWHQVMYHEGSLNFHYDKDESFYSGGRKMKLPLLSSIMYLTNVGGATLIINHIPWSDSLPNESILSFPQKNRYVLFNGTRLHAVLPSLKPPPPPSVGPRVTLLVNYWIDKPHSPGTLPLNYKNAKSYNWIDDFFSWPTLMFWSYKFHSSLGLHMDSIFPFGEEAEREADRFYNLYVKKNQYLPEKIDSTTDAKFTPKYPFKVIDMAAPENHARSYNVEVEFDPNPGKSYEVNVTIPLWTEDDIWYLKWNPNQLRINSISQRSYKMVEHQRYELPPVPFYN